jgi:hypothetical protein
VTLDDSDAVGETVRSTLGVDLANTEAWRRLTARVVELEALCEGYRQDRRARERRRKWMTGLIGGSLATFIAATVFVVRSLMDAGASAEAARAQAALVQRSADKIFQLELQALANKTRLDILFARPLGRSE